MCSNFLCDTKPGDEVKMTGPSGKVMLIPEATPEADLIMVATGTGIAPYRSIIRRLFVEKTPMAADYKGLAWLFLGVANSDALLYDDEWQTILKNFPNNFKLDYALSREMKNKDGGKMYIQDKVAEYADEVFTRMDNGAHMYFCGLKGMMPGILEMLEKVALAPHARDRLLFPNHPLSLTQVRPTLQPSRCARLLATRASCGRRSSSRGRRPASGTSRCTKPHLTQWHSF